MEDLDKFLQIVEAAECACSSVVKKPDDALAHAKLMLALAPFSELQPDQLVEVRVLAEVVRTRIKAFNARRNNIRAREAIRYPAQNLLQALRSLANELGKPLARDCC